MPRNPSDVYSLPAGSIVTLGETIDPSQHNPPLQDIAEDLNNARPIVAGGTGATSAGAARTALGVQAVNANLTSLSGLTLAADKMLYSTAADTLALADLTAAGRALLDDADAAAQRTTLGLAAVAASGAYSDLSGAPPNLTEAQVEDSTSEVFGTVSGQRLSQAVAEFAPPPETANLVVSSGSHSNTSALAFTGLDSSKKLIDNFFAVHSANNSRYVQASVSSDGGSTWSGWVNLHTQEIPRSYSGALSGVFEIDLSTGAWTCVSASANSSADSTADRHTGTLAGGPFNAVRFRLNDGSNAIPGGVHAIKYVGGE